MKYPHRRSSSTYCSVLASIGRYPELQTKKPKHKSDRHENEQLKGKKPDQKDNRQKLYKYQHKKS